LRSWTSSGLFGFAAVRLLPGFQEILASLTDFRFHEHRPYPGAAAAVVTLVA
jgi:hypothetical protein